MIEFKAKEFLLPLKKVLKIGPDRFLNDVSGVVHVGANIGQERDLYSSYGLKVVWIEPIPEVFTQLVACIEGFKSQCAFQELVADVDDKEFEFHIASNNGASSSILELHHHKDIWPSVGFTATVRLKSITLPTLLSREMIDPGDYQALVLDTQGSELLVLQGILPVLRNFMYIKTEVADFESYQGCCQLPDINEFMTKHGYKEFSSRKFASRADGGSYFDIVYKRL